MAKNATPQSGAPRAELSLEMHGYLFEGGLERLEDAYKATVKALKKQKQGATDSVEKTYDPPEALQGEASTEVQLLTAEYHDEISEIDEEFEQTSRLIRDAFVIALYHFWEQQAARWVYNPRGRYVHADVMAWLERNGFQPDQQAVQRLQQAANCLKHGPGDSCKALHKTDTTLFEPSLRIKQEETPNYRMRITTEVLHEWFAAVWRSGPMKKRSLKRTTMIPPYYRRVPSRTLPSEPGG